MVPSSSAARLPIVPAACCALLVAAVPATADPPEGSSSPRVVRALRVNQPIHIDGHLSEPPHLDPMDRPRFEDWCEAQEHVVLYPKAGDCVVFLSHIPHQGAKERDDMERSNVVCHFQVTPMHEGAWFVSRPRGYLGTFPLAHN